MLTQHLLWEGGEMGRNWEGSRNKLRDTLKRKSCSFGKSNVSSAVPNCY